MRRQQPRKLLNQRSRRVIERDRRRRYGPAARARRIRAGIEREPVFFMTAARWFSTVRWLTPRSAAMFFAGMAREHQIHDLASTAG